MNNKIGKLEEHTKIYLVNYNKFAGSWIYKGYSNAWQKQKNAYVVQPPKDFMNTNNDAKDPPYFFLYPNNESGQSEKYIIQATADLIQDAVALKAVERSYKTFLFVQPKVFPHPWGAHNNFVCLSDAAVIKELDQMDNVYLWTFADVNKKFYTQWTKKIHTIPLAFDSVSYIPNDVPKYNQFDISFIGGWANNGFNEKRKIIIDIFSEFKKSGLKCGFFVNKGLTHQQECDILANSKLVLNIHDAYQRILGLDTNERTFKSLGLNGALISDSVTQLENLFDYVPTSKTAKGIVEITHEYLALPEDELREIKERNKKDILENHCYLNRVEQMLSL